MRGSPGVVAFLLRSAILFIIISLDTVRSTPSFPAFPSSFGVTIEQNLLEENISVYTFQYYDTNRIRLETHTDTATIVDIFLFSVNITYHLVVGTSTCTTSQITGNSPPRVLIGGDFFKFSSGSSFNYTYVGTNFPARGILCDKWVTNYSGLDPFGSAMLTNFTLDYYFALPGWSIEGEKQDEYRVPIRAELNGVYYNATYSAAYSHYYEFIDFILISTFDNTLFAQPVACNPGTGSGYSKSQALTAGAISGIVFAALILVAAVVGRIVFVKYYERKNENRPQRLGEEAML